MHRIASLNPNYFALVMSTGIVSLASRLLGMPWLAVSLFWLNVALFSVLWGLFLVRLVLFRPQFLPDLVDHRRGVGFFTSVPATCLLGTQFLLIAEWRMVATVLWALGIVLWFGLTYTIFTSFTVKELKPTLPEGIHGGWLVSVVAAQSVSSLGSMLAAGFGPYQEQLLFFTLCMWLVGGMLYVWIISLIFYRYSFFPLSAAELTPPYWINMGAMAISTLAGTILITASDGSRLLTEILPFVRGVTLAFWATATWWIPMLIVLGVWRHIYRRFRLAYDPQYWGAVFPLGMYTVCTYRLSEEMQLPFLLALPKCTIWIALPAWAVTFLAMLYSLATARSTT